MRKDSFGVVCLWALVSSAPLFAQTGDVPGALQNRLLKTVQALVDAIPVGNKTVWETSLADNAIIVDEFGRVAGKAESVAALHPFPPGFSGSIELRNPRVEQYGDTAVLLVEEYERETVFGQKLVVRYQSVLTFVKQAGTWKVASYADVTIPTAPPKLHVAGVVLGDYQGSYSFGPGHIWKVSNDHGVLSVTTHAGGASYTLEPIAKDAFMGSDDEHNIFIFQRDAQGIVNTLVERRKFNDLSLAKMPSAGG
jgi:hypothetical protein